MRRAVGSRRGALLKAGACCALALLASTLVPAAPTQGAPNQAAGPAEAPAVPAEVKSPPADVQIANRRIVTLRADVLGAPPADRAVAVEERVAAVVEQGGPLEVGTRPIQDGIAVLVDGHVVFRVFDADVDAEVEEQAATVATRAADRLRQALGEIRESRDSRQMLTAAGYSLLATLLMLGLLWAVLRAYRWAAHRVASLMERRSAGLVKTLGHHAVGQLGLERLALVPLKLLAVLVGVIVVYEWLGHVLAQFPYTRPWGEALLSRLMNQLGEFLLAAMRALPGLLFVLLIFLVARFVTRLLRVFFAGIEAGRIELPWVDEATARPTGRLLSAFVWLLALVAAYPYFPGSGSEAFKGIGVFVGLMLSIGSSGVVNQVVSGLMLMYTRSYRPGEFVQVGDTEGVVREIGFLTTRIETLRQEQVTIPNAVIVGNVTRNLSRLAAQNGLRVPTIVTIGYDTPWRQVHALLAQAAGRTNAILRDPPPRILQTALLDYAVEYTMLVGVADPTRRLAALDELHAHIQDVFNEHGVQIMSPRYEADPTQPKVVPPAEWYKAPAVPPSEPTRARLDDERAR
jgi:small-conductance mechanosensitive channel